MSVGGGDAPEMRWWSPLTAEYFQGIETTSQIRYFFPEAQWHERIQMYKRTKKEREGGERMNCEKLEFQLCDVCATIAMLIAGSDPKRKPVYADDALKGNIRQSATGKGVWPLPCRCLVPIWLICQRGVLIMMWGFQGFIDTLRFKCQSW